MARTVQRDCAQPDANCHPSQSRTSRRIGQFAAIQAMAPPSFGVELSPIDVRDAGEIERAITAFARERNGGLIVTASSAARTHRQLIISLAISRPRSCLRATNNARTSCEPSNWRAHIELACTGWNQCCSPSPDAWGRLNAVTPFHHLSENSHNNCPLRAGPITASSYFL
jgi:hypothetical protein